MPLTDGADVGFKNLRPHLKRFSSLQPASTNQSDVPAPNSWLFERHDSSGTQPAA